jgi:hypothetical protein
MDIGGIRPIDGRRIEILSDGLHLFHGAQLAIGATLVSALDGKGRAHAHCATIDSHASLEARKKKEKTYPELMSRRSRTRLVVFVVEVGGRMSKEAATFVAAVATSRAHDEPALLRKTAQASWHKRWMHIIGVSAQRAFAASLLVLPETYGANGELPSVHQVIEDCKSCI